MSVHFVRAYISMYGGVRNPLVSIHYFSLLLLFGAIATAVRRRCRQLTATVATHNDETQHATHSVKYEKKNSLTFLHSSDFLVELCPWLFWVSLLFFFYYIFARAEFMPFVFIETCSFSRTTVNEILVIRYPNTIDIFCTTHSLFESTTMYLSHSFFAVHWFFTNNNNNQNKTIDNYWANSLTATSKRPPNKCQTDSIKLDFVHFKWYGSPNCHLN